MRDGETTTWRRLVLTGGVIGALAIGAAAAGAAVVPQMGAPVALPTSAPPPVIRASATPKPSASPTPTVSPSPTSTGPVRPADDFRRWAAPLASKLGIPVFALEAYGYAEWVLQQTRPTCKLQWTTLAAIGKVTTDHSRVNGAALDPLGRVRPALIGPALDGTGGTVKIVDTDGGALDGDQVWDHAIGPMQFVPSMWRTSRVDADADELADPQDIDDVALAAAYFLCATGKDLTVVANWKEAITIYHGLASRIDKVFDEAQAYGVKSRS